MTDDRGTARPSLAGLSTRHRITASLASARLALLVLTAGEQVRIAQAIKRYAEESEARSRPPKDLRGPHA